MTSFGSILLMFDYKLRSNNAGSIIFVQRHKLHLTITVKVQYHQLLSNLRNHGLITFYTELEFFNIKPLIFQIRCHIPLTHLKVPHVPSLFVIGHFLAFC